MDSSTLNIIFIVLTFLLFLINGIRLVNYKKFKLNPAFILVKLFAFGGCVIALSVNLFMLQSS
jgi:hypothetical protein